MTASLSPVVLSVLLATAAAAQDPPPLPDDPFAALAALSAEPPVATGLEVVVRGADGEPAPDAIVVLMPSSDPAYASMRDAAERRYPGDEPKILAARAVRGTRYRVDGRGTTRVPADQRGRIVALRGDRLASVIRDEVDGADGRRIVLQLDPAWSFAVAVVTADGAPAAGVPVALLEAAGAYPFPRCSTGTDGRAVFRVIPGRKQETARVQALVAATSPCDAAMPAADGGVARLQLPKCIAITARLDADLLPGSTTSWSLALSAEGQRAVAPATAELRRATFPFVEAGLQGEVHCDVDGRRAFAVAIDRPAADTEVLVTAERRTKGRTLVARLLDADGQPVRSATLFLQWEFANGSATNSGRSNAEGWTELEVPENAASGGKVTIEAMRGRWDGPAIGAVTLEFGKLEAPRTDRGELTLQPATVALAGRLLDSEGRGVAGLRVFVRRPDNYRSYAAETGEDGSFRVAMPEPHRPGMELTLGTSDWFFRDAPGEPQRFDARRDDLRIVVQRAGRIRFGAADLPPGVDSAFETYCERADAPEVRVPIAFDPSTKALLLPPGTWDFVVTIDDQEIERLPRVIAESGIETHDPRFMFFDWRSFASVVTLHVQGPDGKPTDACTVWRRYRNGASGRSPSDGVFRMLVAKDGAHITVEAEDATLRELDLGVVTGEHTVRLGAGPLLTVALSAAPALPDGVALVVAADAGGAPVAFDAAQTARLWLPAVGRCAPRLAVRKGERSVPVDFALPAVDVPAAGHCMQVALGPELAAAIARAIQRVD